MVVSLLVIGVLFFGGYAFGEGNGTMLRLRDQDGTCATEVACDQTRDQAQDQDQDKDQDQMQDREQLQLQLRDGSCATRQLVAGISTQARSRTRDRSGDCDGKTVRTKTRSKNTVGRVV